VQLFCISVTYTVDYLNTVAVAHLAVV